jgi:hypothetical protein
MTADAHAGLLERFIQSHDAEALALIASLKPVGSEWKIVEF